MVDRYIYNIANNIKDIRNEYHKTIKVMNGKLHTVSIIESCNFNGFRTFVAALLNMNAKAFMRILTVNESSAMVVWKKRINTERKPWQQRHQMILNKDNIQQMIPKDKKLDLLRIYFSAAYQLQLTDIITYQDGRYIPRNPIPYIPMIMPKSIKYHIDDNPWRDEYMEKNNIIIAIDGSVHYDEEDPRGQIHGYGSCALQVYYNDYIEPVFTQKLSVSNRTHINIMEIEAMVAAFQWINNHKNQITMQQAAAIKIVSDSRNTLQIMAQNYIPKDDAIIRAANELNHHLKVVEAAHYPHEFITIYWTKSHSDSKINKKVDTQAKTAAEYVQNNYPLCESTNYQQIGTWCIKRKISHMNHGARNGIVNQSKHLRQSHTSYLIADRKYI